MRTIWLSCLILVYLAHGRKNEQSQKYWNDVAEQELHNALRAEILNRNIAKNAILFIGAGMGISTQTAGRIYKAQKNGKEGAEAILAMDKFPHIGLSRTYSVDREVPDEAETATAILCGVKTKSQLIALSARANYEWCLSGKGREVQSVLMDAFNAGKSTGIVTTKQIVDATVAAAYAHSVSDKWYSDALMPTSDRAYGCKDIAMQFYEASGNITVALGGGRKHMFANLSLDVEYSTANGRLDGKDLIQMWKNKEKKKGLNPIYVWNQSQFDSVDVGTTDRLIGLFEPEDMRYEADRAQDIAGEPSLSEMTAKALEMLKKNDEGYFLLVEGGRIDDSHHDNIAYNALNDLAAFDDAIATAVSATSPEDTLIIVTSDHGDVMTIGGSTDRGSDILGLAKTNGLPKNAYDEKNMTTLLYGNGPGFLGWSLPDKTGKRLPAKIAVRRFDPNATTTTSPTYMQQSAVPLKYATHGGEDVSIMASGPMAHLFHGVHEQHYIAHVIRYTLCIGSSNKHCDEGYKAPGIVEYQGGILYVTEAERILKIQFICLIVLAVVVFLLLLTIIILYRQSKTGNQRHTDQSMSRETVLSAR